MSDRTVIEQTSDREVVVTRTFDAPARIVYEAWTRPELMMRWWAPESLGFPLRACEMDVRVGGGYRLEFGQDAENTMAFFGKYVEVEPPSRLVWTNDESGQVSVTTVTFEEKDGRTLLTVHELHPSKEALEENGGGILPEQFEQLDALLASLRAGA